MRLPRMLSAGVAAVALVSTFLLTSAAGAAPNEATPSSIAVSEYRASGVTAVLTGFQPGETVEEIFSGGPTGTTVVADGQGIATFEFIPAEHLVVPGTYTLGGHGLTSDRSRSAEFTVVADPEPARATVTLTPATLTVTAWATVGVTGVMTGFTPGEVVNEAFATPGMGGQTGRTAVADANGSVTFQYLPAAENAIAGTFYLGGEGADSGTIGFAEITVVADPVVAPAAPAVPVPARATFTG